MQHRTTDQLNVEVPHAERPARRLANHGERLRQQTIDRLARRQTGAEFVSLGSQLLVAERLQGGLECVRGAHVARETLQHPIVAAAENTGQKI